jgi:outer membrane protein assembly factor BamB
VVGLVGIASSGAPAAARPAAPGDPIWVGRVDGPEHLDDFAQAVAVSPDGTTVFVAGTISYPLRDGLTIAYDAVSGVVLWRNRQSAVDSADAIAVSPDGATVFVAGTSVLNTFDYATVAYDAATGDVLWNSRFDAGPSDHGVDVTTSPDGSRVFVTGDSSVGGDVDVVTLAYDAVSGAQLWEQRYHSAGAGEDLASKVGMSPDGQTVFVAAKSPAVTESEWDFVTFALVADSGDPIWVRRAPARSASKVRVSMGVTSDGASVVVTGDGGTGGSTADYTTVSYQAATGATRWTRRYDGSGHGDDFPTGIAVSSDGTSVVVTGYSMDSGTEFDMATLSYDASTGATRWVRRLVGPGSSREVALAMSVSPDGSHIYVAGGSSFDFGVLTVAYLASTGSRLWVRSYTGPGGFDMATDVASSDGAVFVTGYSYNAQGNADYVTVSYSA